MLMFGWDFLLMLSRDSEDEMWSRFMFELLIWLQEVTLARWTQPSGPLCLWQCLLLFFTFWITFSLDSLVLICLKNSCQFNLSDFSAMYEGILFSGTDKRNESNLLDVGRLFIDPIVCVCLITKFTSVSLLSFGINLAINRFPEG